MQASLGHSGLQPLLVLDKFSKDTHQQFVFDACICTAPMHFGFHQVVHLLCLDISTTAHTVLLALI